jgi:hypothetical protein
VNTRKKRQSTIAAIGTAGLLLGGAAMADRAPNNCGDASMATGVQFLTLQPAQNLTLFQQSDGSFTTDVRVRVFCMKAGVDLGEVTGSQIRISTTVPNTTVNGIDATGIGATINIPSGIASLQLRSTNPGLSSSQWWARVGSDTMSVSLAFDQAVSADDSPVQIGRVFAQTPELGSLLLFGSGAAGFAGYAITRRRARRRV